MNQENPSPVISENHVPHDNGVHENHEQNEAAETTVTEQNPPFIIPATLSDSEGNQQGTQEQSENAVTENPDNGDKTPIPLKN